MRRAGNATVNYQHDSELAKLTQEEYAHIRREQINQVAAQFANQQISDTQNTIYSIFLTFNNFSWSIAWADIFTYPDLFFVVEAEGRDQVILPEIWTDYKGGPVQAKLVLPDLPPGTRVVLRVMDDDSDSNEIWNTILKRRLTYNFTPSAEIGTALGPIRIATTISGSIQGLDDSQFIKLDAPDQLATVTFTTPLAYDETWVADSRLIDSNDTDVGTIQFSQVWNTRAQLASLENRLSQRARDANDRRADTFGWLIFWSVAGIVALFMFFRANLKPST